ncbi:hypothetical protein HYH03_008572 [Edaphochlamys debaryana]|uniref:Uncharacterized protein n=1 Tax=Edaphochlamys debaryana TaxID=47281 RepID=A0A835Y1W4_9CHLO|nr:hypothetical protein HYH03_008572 [Edaphochlamys debaryana]|eukprot:KAG2493148.1 hypothetical protein HYH03_008572 [Edaphochlamys debaryana]
MVAAEGDNDAPSPAGASGRSASGAKASSTAGALKLPSCAALAEQHPQPLPTPEHWAASEAWLEAAVQHAQSQAPALFAYFRSSRKDDQTVMIMGYKDQFLSTIFPTAPSSQACSSRNPGKQDSDEEGAEAGGVSAGLAAAYERNRVLGLRTTYLYYSVLLYTLRKLYPMTLPGPDPSGAAGSRFAKPSVAAADAPLVAHLLSIPVFHSSLLTVAAMLAKAVDDRDPTCLGATPDLFLRTARAAGFEPNMMALWNAARWFQEAFVSSTSPFAPGCAAPAPNSAAPSAGGSSRPAPGVPPPPPPGPLPPLPGRLVIGRLMRLAEERGVLAQGSTFYAILSQGATGGFTDGDSTLLRNFLEAYSRRALARATDLAARLLQEQPQPQAGSAGGGSAALAPALPRLAAELMDSLLANRLDLAFNQHMSVLAACVLYGLAKALHLRMPFSAITRSLLAALPDHTPDLFERQVELKPAAGPPESATGGAGGAEEDGGAQAAGAAAVMGDVRSFYNEVFLPRAEGLVRTVVRKAATAAAASAEDQSAPVATAPSTGAAVAPAEPSPVAARPAAAAAKPVPAKAGPAPAAAAASGASGDGGFSFMTPPAAAAAAPAPKAASTAAIALAPAVVPAAAPVPPPPAAAAPATSVASLQEWERVTLPPAPSPTRTASHQASAGGGGGGRRLSVLSDYDLPEEEEEEEPAQAPTPRASTAKPGVLRTLRGAEPNTAAAVAAASAAVAAAVAAGSKKPPVGPSAARKSLTPAASPGLPTPALPVPPPAVGDKENGGVAAPGNGPAVRPGAGGRRQGLRQYR